MTGLRMTLLAAIGVAALALVPPAPAQQNEETITLNLRDADILEVIAMVSEVTGRNFVVDPRVRARVTVVSARPLTPDGLYQTFLSVLQVNQFAAVPTGDTIKIVPVIEARHSSGVEPPPPHGEEDIVTRVIQVQNVPAAQMQAVLRPLVPQFGHIAAFAPSNMLVISDRAGNVDRLASIIGRIDQATDDEVEVIRLQHASAADAVRLLTALTQAQARGEGASPPTIAADERTNSVLLGGHRALRLRLRALLAHLDTPLDIEGATQVVYLRYGDAQNIASILSGYAESQAQRQAAAQGTREGQTASTARRESTTILADMETNSLVITAAASEMRNLRSIIDQLDIRRAQVLVEALIVEVTSDRSAEFGVQWGLDGTDSNRGAGIINFSAAGLTAAQVLTGTITSAPDGASLAIGRVRDGSTSIGALIRAFAGEANTNILSTPTLVAMDNEEATINVGQTVPFITGQFTGAQDGAGQVNPFQTINREDIGLKLTITPKINEGDAVQLLIHQEVSSLAPGTTGAVDLITNKREISTRVIVQDGDIIVLGGLIDDTVQHNQQRVPILGSIPILGHAFRYQRTTAVKRNLMVFLQPRILRDAESATLQTNQRYRRMQQLQQMLESEQVPLMPDVRRPSLPPIDEPELQREP
ncbi:MAG: type II secretion system secretin GspD [Xanthomonadaceae bacterium]|nr:type II secretion system secretin GspD [Xanthomonadaceae bacterium]